MGKKKKHKPITEKKKFLLRQLRYQLNKQVEQTRKRKTQQTNLLKLQCYTVPTLWIHSIEVL